MEFVMANNMQDVFWEIALTKSREEFLLGKQAHKFGATYRKGCAKPVRVNREQKSSIFAASAAPRRSIADMRAGRV
jgi:hypothetical protein